MEWYGCCLTNQNEGQTKQMYFVTKNASCWRHVHRSKDCAFSKFISSIHILFSPPGLLHSNCRVFSLLLPFSTKQIWSPFEKVWQSSILLIPRIGRSYLVKVPSYISCCLSWSEWGANVALSRLEQFYCSSGLAGYLVWPCPFSEPKRKKGAAAKQRRCSLKLFYYTIGG